MKEQHVGRWTSRQAPPIAIKIIIVFHSSPDMVIFHSSSDTVFLRWTEGVCATHYLLSVTPAAALTIAKSLLLYLSSSPIPGTHLPNLTRVKLQSV